MKEETFIAVMSSTDPARDLTDDVLEEFLPKSHLAARINERIAEETVRMITAEKMPLWRRVPVLVTSCAVATSLVVAGVMTFASSASSFVISGVALPPKIPIHSAPPTNSPSHPVSIFGSTFRTGSAVPVPKVPACRSGQVSETLHLQTVDNLSSYGWQGWVTIENHGAPCFLRRTWVGLALVAGKSHRLLEATTTPPSPLSGFVILATAQTAVAPLALYVDGPNTLNICHEQVANGVVVPSLYKYWPSEFFSLPSELHVCLTDPTATIAGGLLVKEV